MLHDQHTDKQARLEKIMTVTQLHDDPHYPLVMPLLPVLYWELKYSGPRYWGSRNIDRIARYAGIKPRSGPNQERTKMKSKPGQLVVVSTPIGNLGDFSPRAAEILATADILACEDTRMTRKLLALTGHQTNAKLMPYHDHNGHNMRPKLLSAIANGLHVALVSDAGTPLVSDPGYKLVAAAH